MNNALPHILDEQWMNNAQLWMNNALPNILDEQWMNNALPDILDEQWMNNAQRVITLFFDRDSGNNSRGRTGGKHEGRRRKTRRRRTYGKRNKRPSLVGRSYCLEYYDIKFWPIPLKGLLVTGLQ